MPKFSPDHKSNCLLIFVRNTLRGQVKSRLAKSVGNSAALAVYNALIEQTRKILNDNSYEKYVFYSDYIDRLDVFENDNFEKKIQLGNDLGERMSNAFKFAFSRDYRRVVLIGSDIPLLTNQIIVGAFQALNGYDLVLGPANDGGYYLIGMEKLNSDLFNNIHWSTQRVLQQTLHIAQSNNILVKLMPELVDVDTAEDLKQMGEKEQDYFNKIINGHKTTSNPDAY